MIISLQALFTNKTREKILLFLLVNETAYPSQIHTLLNLPLTPIQREFQALETHGIVQHTQEGKTKLYRLNPAYPMHKELQGLLRKAYVLLPSCDKKLYCFNHLPYLASHEERVSNSSKKEQLLFFWEQLLSMRYLFFSIYSPMREGKKEGRAEVLIKTPSDSVIVFQEKGEWLDTHTTYTSFSNSLRFTLDLSSLVITLEHLRYGEHHPVFLFHLAPYSKNALRSTTEHLCLSDSYLGHMRLAPKGIVFDWRVIGPQKNDFFSYHYTP